MSAVWVLTMRWDYEGSEVQGVYATQAAAIAAAEADRDASLADPFSDGYVGEWRSVGEADAIELRVGRGAGLTVTKWTVRE